MIRKLKLASSQLKSHNATMSSEGMQFITWKRHTMALIGLSLPGHTFSRHTPAYYANNFKNQENETEHTSNIY